MRPHNLTIDSVGDTVNLANQICDLCTEVDNNFMASQDLHDRTTHSEPSTPLISILSEASAPELILSKYTCHDLPVKFSDSENLPEVYKNTVILVICVI